MKLNPIVYTCAQLRFIVVDEANTFGGAVGAETACVIRRLRAFCGRASREVVWVGASATLGDMEAGAAAARAFASRFFGVPERDVEVLGEEYREDEWAADRSIPSTPSGGGEAFLAAVLDALADEKAAGARLTDVLGRLVGLGIDTGEWRDQLYWLLAANELCFILTKGSRAARGACGRGGGRIAAR